jgi:hypothetical protein
MQMAVGWLTQDHMSQSDQHPPLDILVTTDKLTAYLNIRVQCVDTITSPLFFHMQRYLAVLWKPLMLYSLTICLQKRKHHHRIEHYWKLEIMMVIKGMNSMVIDTDVSSNSAHCPYLSVSVSSARTNTWRSKRAQKQIESTGIAKT